MIADTTILAHNRNKLLNLARHYLRFPIALSNGTCIPYVVPKPIYNVPNVAINVPHADLIAKRK